MKILSAGSSMTNAEVKSQTKFSFMKEIKMHMRMKEG
jgi:hypothetical protein